MKRICAWHPQNFGFTLVIEDGTGHETHGICPDCKTIEVAKLGTFRLEQFGEPYLPYQPQQQRRDLATGRITEFMPWSDVGDALTDVTAKKEELRKAQVRVQGLIVGNC